MHRSPELLYYTFPLIDTAFNLQMKQLVIGIDAGTRSVFERMPMPYLHSLMKSCVQTELKVDLLSRGWAEQLSGEYAASSKAFYVFPESNGSRKVTMKYSLGDMLANIESPPIWRIAESAGAKVGLMNIPTTYPAPSVDGFFVSGAGGGMNKVAGIPDELCFPKTVVNDLASIGYLIDLRLGTAGLNDVSELFDLLEEMIDKRTEAFISLCGRYKVDFGFIAYRALAVLQYLGMSELNALWYRKGLIDKSPGFEPTAVWANRAEPFFAKFDECLKRAIVALAPEHLMITSDHGIGETEYVFNPNAFLKLHGFQPECLQIRESLVNSIRKRRRILVHKVAWSRTRAFSDWYSSAIYINDQTRFSGPVRDSTVDKLVDSICELWNCDAETQNLGMHAVPYRRYKKGERFSDLCPDIKIEHERAHFMASASGPFITKNPNYGPVTDLTGIGGMHSGNKTPFPFFLTDHKTASLIRNEDPRDLTLVYKLTDRIFTSQLN